MGVSDVAYSHFFCDVAGIWGIRRGVYGASSCSLPGLPWNEMLSWCDWELQSLRFICTIVSGEEDRRERQYRGTVTEDDSYPMSVEYVNYAGSKGIPIHFEDMPGGHEWAVWDAMIRRFPEWCMS